VHTDGSRLASLNCCDDAKGMLVTRVCVSLCVPVARRIPTLLHGPGRKLEEWYMVPSSYALLGGFAIGARVSLL